MIFVHNKKVNGIAIFFMGTLLASNFSYSMEQDKPTKQNGENREDKPPQLKPCFIEDSLTRQLFLDKLDDHGICYHWLSRHENLSLWARLFVLDSSFGIAGESTLERLLNYGLPLSLLRENNGWLQEVVTTFSSALGRELLLWGVPRTSLVRPHDLSDSLIAVCFMELQFLQQELTSSDLPSWVLPLDIIYGSQEEVVQEKIKLLLQAVHNTDEHLQHYARSLLQETLLIALAHNRIDLVEQLLTHAGKFVLPETFNQLLIHAAAPRNSAQSSQENGKETENRRESLAQLIYEYAARYGVALDHSTISRALVIAAAQLNEPAIAFLLTLNVPLQQPLDRLNEIARMRNQLHNIDDAYGEMLHRLEAYRTAHVEAGNFLTTRFDSIIPYELLVLILKFIAHGNIVPHIHSKQL